jgi:hypothetical protein
MSTTPTKVILLYSSLATDQVQIINSTRLETALQAKKMVVDKVDGSLADSKELRDVLFGISGKRGKYPQCFISDGKCHTFVGLWDEVESLLESDSLPKDILDANPGIPTFTKVLR